MSDNNNNGAVIDVNDGEEVEYEIVEEEEKSSCTHPIVCFFHLFFKILAVAMYLILWYFVDFVIGFIIIVICVAVDFWTTKNVTGRLLVGLRWWNEVDEEGNSVWRFEALPESEKSRLNQLEGMIFWGGMAISPLFWVLCFLTNVLKINIQYTTLVVIALILNIVNLSSYIKCAKGARKKLRKVVVKKATKVAIDAAVSDK